MVAVAAVALAAVAALSVLVSMALLGGLLLIVAPLQLGNYYCGFACEGTNEELAAQAFSKLLQWSRLLDVFGVIGWVATVA
eukprot:COSAG02_NODE_112_length_35994_cov_12.152695_2_plen_81_part_00